MDIVRQVICLNHLFKNAGSTISWILRQNFHRHFFDFRRLKAEGVTGMADVASLLERFDKLQAMEVHHFAMGAMRCDGYRIHNIIFLRDPIVRLRSTYDFYRQRPPASGDLIDIAQACELKEFLSHLLAMETPVHLESQQTRRLRAMNRPPTDDDRAAVTEMMTSITVPGLVERFDDCMVLAETALSSHFPGIDMAYVRQNTTSPAVATAERLETIRRQIGDELFEAIQSLNAHDYALIDAVNADIDRRIRDVPDFDARKADHVRRCQQLHAKA